MQTVSTNSCFVNERGKGQIHNIVTANSKAIGIPRQKRKYEAWIQ